MNDTDNKPAATITDLPSVRKIEDMMAANAGDETIEANGVFISATVVVQCLDCGEPIVAEVVNEDPMQVGDLASEDIACPKCSEKQAKPVVIPVLIAAGPQVSAIEELWESTAQLGEGRVIERSPAAD